MQNKCRVKIMPHRPGPDPPCRDDQLSHKLSPGFSRDLRIQWDHDRVEVADGVIVFIIGFNRWDFCPLSSREMNLSCVE